MLQFHNVGVAIEDLGTTWALSVDQRVEHKKPAHPEPVGSNVLEHDARRGTRPAHLRDAAAEHRDDHPWREEAEQPCHHGEISVIPRVLSCEKIRSKQAFPGDALMARDTACTALAANDEDFGDDEVFRRLPDKLARTIHRASGAADRHCLRERLTMTGTRTPLYVLAQALTRCLESRRAYFIPRGQTRGSVLLRLR